VNKGAYSNFINSIRTEETKTKYIFCINDFIKFVKTDRILELKDLQQRIIDYILDMRKRKLSSSTVHTRLSAVYHFYAMNDVVLNKVKIGKFKGEYIKVKRDRPYTREEIGKMLNNADIRMKVAILVMASGGLRVGAVPSLRLRDLQKYEDVYKVTVYENTNQEYYTFVTPECSVLIDEYIKQRKEIGEKMTPDSYLIREHFDIFNPKMSRGVAKNTIRNILNKILAKSGIRVNVFETHGLRKFFATQCKIDPEIRERLLGHDIGLTLDYVKPSVEDIYTEYERAIDNLTINEENRLRKKVETLQIEKSRLEAMEADLKIIKEKMK
jgi:integrase/recombinase XerD